MTTFRLLATCAAVACMAFLAGAIAAAAQDAGATDTTLSDDAGTAVRPPRAIRPKVMVVSMYKDEGDVWLKKLGPWKETPITGLSPDYPTVHCNVTDVCLMTTGMGHASAAASMMALTFAPNFDLRRTYFLIAGIAGIDPAVGTLGSATWANYLVEFGLQWEVDAREKPAGWKNGYTGIFAKTPDTKPPLEYRTEVFKLNERLVDVAYALSRNSVLADSPQAGVTRSKYDRAPANQPPAVLKCDTESSDVWWSGNAIGERARDWMKIMTEGKGLYCTTQQEDNATYEALTRAARAKRVDLRRVAVLRTGADFDRPPKGIASVDNLQNTNGQGGEGIALENLFQAGNPLVHAIVTHWSDWRIGVPSPQ